MAKERLRRLRQSRAMDLLPQPMRADDHHRDYPYEGKDYSKDPFPEGLSKHNALDDSKHQIRYLVRAMDDLYSRPSRSGDGCLISPGSPFSSMPGEEDTSSQSSSQGSSQVFSQEVFSQESSFGGDAKQVRTESHPPSFLKRSSYMLSEE